MGKSTVQIQAESVFSEDAITAIDVWETIRQTLLIGRAQNSMAALYVESMPLCDITRAIVRYRLGHFEVALGLQTFQYSLVRNYGIAVFQEAGFADRDLDQITCLLDKFAAKDGFVVARLYDADYDFWQNASDPLQYTLRHRSLDGVTLKSNGLPYPLAQQEVDTSENVGRRVLRQGYIEFVGHGMWIGRKFWTITDQDRALAVSSMKIEEHEQFDRLFIRDEPFTELNRGEESQRMARSLIFGHSVQKSAPCNTT